MCVDPKLLGEVLVFGYFFQEVEGSVSGDGVNIGASFGGVLSWLRCHILINISWRMSSASAADLVILSTKWKSGRR